MWCRITKGDPRGRAMADRHYTRQTPGHPMWTRPGYNFVMYSAFAHGEALWCWWRPKWEDGRPGTQRKDGLRVIECTMFRREGDCPYLASEMVAAAVYFLGSTHARRDLHLDAAGRVDALITGVGSEATSARRSARHAPGHCFLMAGWEPMDKAGGRADVWLSLPWQNPFEEVG